jgi:hypothetical protein
VFEGQSVTETAIVETPQAVELRADAPGAGGAAVHRFGHAVAVGGGDGQGEALVVDLHLVVAQGNDAGQHRIAIQAQFQGFALFQVDATQGVRLEIPCQVQAVAAVDSQQWRQVFVLLCLLQVMQAGVDLGVVIGRMTEAFEHRAQGVWLYALRAAVGVDPIDGQARAAGEDFQFRFAQGCSPAGDRVTRALYGGSCAP